MTEKTPTPDEGIEFDPGLVMAMAETSESIWDEALERMGGPEEFDKPGGVAKLMQALLEIDAEQNE